MLPAALTQDGEEQIGYLKSCRDSFEDGGTTWSPQRQHPLPQRAEGQQKTLHGAKILFQSWKLIQQKAMFVRNKCL